jgi:hypothetical protein
MEQLLQGMAVFSRFLKLGFKGMVLWAKSINTI